MDGELRTRVIKGSFWGFLTSVFNKVGALLFTIVLARVLAPTNYGIYSLAFSVVMVFSTFTDLGIGATLVRYISKAIISDKRAIHSYYSYLLKVKFILTCIFATILIAIAYPLSFFVFKNEALFLPILISAAYLFAYSFENFYWPIFNAIEKFGYNSIKEAVSQVLRIVFVLFLFVIVSEANRVFGIFIALTILSIIMIIVGVYYLKKVSPIIFYKTNKKIDKKEVRRFLLYLTIGSISGVFFAYIDSLLLGVYVSPEFVGYYRAAFAMIMGIVGLVSFPGSILLPIFAKISLSNAGIALNKTLKYVAIIAVPSVFGVMILGKYFITLLLGYSYLQSTLPLIVLSLLIIPTTYTAIILPLFSSQGRPQVFARLMIITNIINIVLNIVLIKLLLPHSELLATVGAAAATVISWFFYLVASTLALKKDFKLNIRYSHLIRPLLASAVMTISIYYILKVFGDINLLKGLILTIFGILVYLIVLYLIKGIKWSEISFIRSLLAKKPFEGIKNIK
jgi:O-antigen/teichoic acid export membrane protein